jgi:hypothetical protein
MRIVYLTTLSVTQATQRPAMSRLVSNELKKTWEEAIVV